MGYIHVAEAILCLFMSWLHWSLLVAWASAGTILPNIDWYSDTCLMRLGKSFKKQINCAICVVFTTKSWIFSLSYVRPPLLRDHLIQWLLYTGFTAQRSFWVWAQPISRHCETYHPRTFADKNWIRPVKLLCIIMFKIGPKSLLGPVKAKKCSRCLQYEEVLLCNAFSHWPSPYTEWSPCIPSQSMTNIKQYVVEVWLWFLVIDLVGRALAVAVRCAVAVWAC